MSIVNVVSVRVRRRRRDRLGDGATASRTPAQIPTGQGCGGQRGHRRAAGRARTRVEMGQERLRNARVRFRLLVEHRFGLRGKNRSINRNSLASGRSHLCPMIIEALFDEVVLPLQLVPFALVRGR